MNERPFKFLTWPFFAMGYIYGVCLHAWMMGKQRAAERMWRVK